MSLLPGNVGCLFVGRMSFPISGSWEGERVVSGVPMRKHWGSTVWLLGAGDRQPVGGGGGQACKCVGCEVGVEQGLWESGRGNITLQEVGPVWLQGSRPAGDSAQLMVEGTSLGVTEFCVPTQTLSQPPGTQWRPLSSSGDAVTAGSAGNGILDSGSSLGRGVTEPHCCTWGCSTVTKGCNGTGQRTELR